MLHPIINSFADLAAFLGSMVLCVIFAIILLFLASSIAVFLFVFIREFLKDVAKRLVGSKK